MASGIYSDLALLALVVEAGSFTAASKVSGLSKSLLSRRVAELEKDLGVRLIDRTSRRFAPTPLGLEMCHHGQIIQTQGEAALMAAKESHRNPSGALRVAAPVALAEILVGGFCVDFARRYPAVSLNVDVADGTRMPNVGGYDVVLSATMASLPSSEIVARRLTTTEYQLVASADCVSGLGVVEGPQDLENFNGIGWWDDGHVPKWQLHDGNGATFELHIHPRFVTNNLFVARQAALAGLGIARLPDPLCRSDIQTGALKCVLTDWRPQTVSVYALYPSRRSLTLAGRTFVKEIAALFDRWSAAATWPDIDSARLQYAG